MFRVVCASVWAIGLFAGTVASAQDGDAAAEAEEAADLDAVGTSAERCLSLASIRRTEVIDDDTIIFHMRAGRTFLNQLPRTCPGLERNEQFMYEVSTSRLCSTDWITVLERFGGLGPSRGFTCRLGEFFAIDEDTVAALRGGAEGSGDRGAVEMTPIELPPPDDQDVESPDSAGSAETQ